MLRSIANAYSPADGRKMSVKVRWPGEDKILSKCSFDPWTCLFKYLCNATSEQRMWSVFLSNCKLHSARAADSLGSQKSSPSAHCLSQSIVLPVHLTSLF